MNPPASHGLPAPALAPCRISGQFEDDFVALIPHLRAFSRMLCGKRAIAEDVAQEALAKAWRARGSFEPGTSLKAWLFTILRNEFCSHARRAKRETPLDDDFGERIAGSPCEQEWTIELADAARALGQLPNAQRKALILIAAGGFSYGEAAQISGVPEGTVKSRVARARAALSRILDGDRPLPRCSRRHVAASQDILAQLNIITRTGAQDDAVRA